MNEVLNYPRWEGKTYSAGCYNPSSRTDGGSISPHARNPAEAGDIGIKPAWRGRNSIGQEIFGLLIVRARQIGLVQGIWDGQIWTDSRPYIRAYTTNPHRDHIHFQLAKSFALSSRTTLGPLPGAAPSAPAPIKRKAKRMSFIQTAGGDAIAVTDGQSKIIMLSPKMLGEFQWLCGVQGGNPNVTIVSKATWDVLPTVNA